MKTKWHELQRPRKLTHTLRLLLLLMPISIGGCFLLLEPAKESERVVRILKVTPPSTEESVTGIEFLEWRNQSKNLASIAAYISAGQTFRDGTEPERVRSGQVSADFFGLFGTTPIMGRSFTTDEYRSGAPQVAILSHPFWQRRLGSDPSVIGKTVDLDNESYTVVGVMPPEFQLPDEYEIWIPLALDDDSLRLKDSSFGLSVIARLKPNMTIDEAQTEMSNIQRSFSEKNPATGKGQSVKVTSLQDAKRLYKKGITFVPSYKRTITIELERTP